MPKDNLPAFYWDTSVFLMVLEGHGNYPKDALSAANQIISLVEESKARIFSSELLHAEVLYGKNGTRQMETFFRWLGWKTVTLLPINKRTLQDAADVRWQAKQSAVKGWLGDAIHIACARFVEADILAVHALDTGFKTVCGQVLSTVPCCDPKLALGQMKLVPTPVVDDAEADP